VIDEDPAGGDRFRVTPRTPFELRTVVVRPGDVRAYDAAEWRDAIVAVETGEIELEGVSGVRCRFGRGALLFLAGVPLRALHNSSGESVVLRAVARRRVTGPR
jgi:hypothetical protein